MTQTVAIASPSSLRRIYDWTIRSASTPKAVWTVTLVSFAESSFFPLPPDLMLIPMILADRAKAWWLAFICTISSVLGGLAGYAIGYFLFETAGEWIIQTYHLENAFGRFQTDFQAWGFWIIVLKGLTPIPFKLVTIASGVAGLNLTQFVLASLIARSFRFFLLAGLLWFFGDWARTFIERYLPYVLGGMLALLIAGFLAVKILAG
ncbi:MAG: cytochrome [Alphaproteobacteria bacterium]|jgi:membrane protein YqaA with SNARE-associated domain|nr:cytochrome [Alphaproteobacteria bacterium]